MASIGASLAESWNSSLIAPGCLSENTTSKMSVWQYFSPSSQEVQSYFATRSPLAALPLREDLRTRLGWGLVYELTPLADADKPMALAAFAKQRGFRLSTEVIAYLLAHGRRDMPALLATLASLDRHSLATKRAITVPMLRDWLNRDLDLGP